MRIKKPMFISKLICFCLLISNCNILFAAIDITGKYKCSGDDPYIKSKYDTDLTINKTNETYNFVWTELEERFQGTGFISNLIPNTIVAEFWNPDNKPRSGVILYRINPDGTLEGEWTRSELDLIGTENCKK